MKYVLLGLTTIAVLALMTVALTSVRPSEATAGSRGTDAPLTPDTVDPTVIEVVGDSYSGGSPEDSGLGFRWPALVASELGATVTTSHRSGIGYAQTTAEGINFNERATQLAGGDDLVVVFGSRNDLALGYDEVRAGAEQTYATIRESQPEVPLLVIGPAWVDAEPPAGIFEARDATRDAALAVGATFVDPVEEGWFTDVPDLIGTDGVHPNDAGHRYLAGRILPSLEAALVVTE